MRVEELTRNKPVFFQHVVEKKRTRMSRMLEKYRIWQKPVIDKKKGKMRFDKKKNGNMVFPVYIYICTQWYNM